MASRSALCWTSRTAITTSTPLCLSAASGRSFRLALKGTKHKAVISGGGAVTSPKQSVSELPGKQILPADLHGGTGLGSRHAQPAYADAAVYCSLACCSLQTCNLHAAAVNLTAVKSGELALLKPRYGWLPYGDSGHFVLDVFRPNETWYVWLLACRRLGPTAQPGGEELGSAAAGAGSNGDGNGSESSGDEPMYVVQLLRRKWGGYTWHGSRRKRGQSKTSSPLTMKVRVWCGHQLHAKLHNPAALSLPRTRTACCDAQGSSQTFQCQALLQLASR